MHRVRQLHGRLRVGAKNTLVKNNLALAEGLGATIEPLRTVVDVRPLPGSAAYRVTTEATGAWLRKDRRTVTAQQVVFAAGAWGTSACSTPCATAVPSRACPTGWGT